MGHAVFDIGSTGLKFAIVRDVLSTAANQDDQGKVMGNNQALQVGAEALSGILGGMLAAVMVKLSLIVLAVIAILAALLLKFRSKENAVNETP